MTMGRKYLLVLLLSITCPIRVAAQTDFYYYKGEKIPLFLNEDKVVISNYKTDDDISQRILANVQALYTTQDKVFDYVVVSRLDFNKLTSLDFWEEDAKSVMVSPCYFTEDNYELYLDPYISVKLKKEQDVDLLNAYAEENRLVNRGIVIPSMPLWYGLYVTPESGKNALECANELWESGDFASAQPDFFSGGSLIPEGNTIQGITTATRETFPEIYDLQGRPVTTPPARGIYIKDGKKYYVK